MGLAIVLRRPRLLSAPRFWEEEGWSYLPFAWQHGFWETSTRVFAGYIDLSANIPSALAIRLAPLEHAPLVTTLCAALFQWAPYGVVVFSRAPFWSAPGKRFLGLLLVLTAPVTSEIWLNTTTSKFHLSLAAALLLLETPGAMTRLGGILQGLLLAFVGLSSPVALFLAPLFAWKAWRSRHPLDLANLAVLGAVGSFQAFCLIGSGSDPAASRGGTADPLQLFPALANKCVLTPLLGSRATALLADRCTGFLPLAQYPLAAVSLNLLAMVVFVSLSLLLRRTPLDRRVQLGGSAALLAIFSYFAAASVSVVDDRMLFPLWNARYYFAPTCLLLLLLLESAWSTDPLTATRRQIARVLLALVLVQGAWGFKSFNWMNTDWPAWSDEVAAWRKAPERPLRVWPPEKTVRLDPAERNHGW